MNKAKENNVSVMDVADRGIAQNDSRSILRRGTAEGYSEVDFVALTGEVFRSRWTVRRSRGKVDGSLQKVEMTLTNLTSGVEQQGTKTELLSHISKLIGLSFEQFNRSVLLAQGDFATFLKARQTDKAEILEKLTEPKFTHVSLLPSMNAPSGRKVNINYCKNVSKALSC